MLLTLGSGLKVVAARGGKGAEQRLVEQFIAQAAVEALDEAVLLGLSWRDVMPADARLI